VPADVGALQVVTLTNVICVVFVTHAYETVFLIREREIDLLRMARLERVRAQAELDGLKAQIDPHFLFNSLNTLGHLVTRDPPAARAFCDALAALYRHVLACRERDLVPAIEELEIVRAYRRLLALRFGDAIELEIDDEAGDAARLRVPPLALQTLLENAVKHNQLGPDAPLRVRLRVERERLVVENAVRPRTSVRPSTGVGLRNLDERCRALVGRGLDIRARGDVFRVALPALRATSPS
jgi:LytS/YehU family sensor histidine kinase